MFSDEGLNVLDSFLTIPESLFLKLRYVTASDQSHFTKIFRRIMGVTPTGYRAAL